MDPSPNATANGSPSPGAPSGVERVGARGRVGEGPDSREPTARGVVARIADLHAALAEEYRRLAEAPEIQLAAGAGSRLMGDMDATAPTEPAPARLLSVADLAGRLGVAAKTVRAWRSQGKLPPAIDLGSVLRWREDTIESWLREREEAYR